MLTVALFVAAFVMAVQSVIAFASGDGNWLWTASGVLAGLLGGVAYWLFWRATGAPEE